MKMNCFKAGFFKQLIIPDFPICLYGRGEESTRIIEGIESPIYATAVAISSNDKSLLLISLDLYAIQPEQSAQIKTEIEKNVGIEQDAIIIGTIHTHNAPAIFPSTIPNATRYFNLVKTACVSAAKEAKNDLSPCTLSYAAPIISSMNFNRHYISDNGTLYSSNLGIPNEAKLVGHAGKNDPQMPILCFSRNGKKDILLTNWQAHPDSSYANNFYLISPSWIGKMREELEELSGKHVAYFTGATGNLTMESRIPSEAHHLKWDEYGKKMGKLAFEALKDLKTIPFSNEGLSFSSKTLIIPLNHSEDNIVSTANNIISLYLSGKITEARELCKQNGIVSMNHAFAIKKRASLPKEESIIINSVSIGPIGISAISAEPFAEQGLAVKASSPFDLQLVITGNYGYLADRSSFEQKTYEAVELGSFYEKESDLITTKAMIAELSALKQ